MNNIDTNDRPVCQDHDPEIWHNDETEAQAIRLCNTGRNGRPCPQLASCLRTGTDPANRAWTGTGVWGGMGSRRRALIRARLDRDTADRDQTVTFTATNCRTPMQESSL